MYIAITPDYKDILNEEVPNLKDLIADIPTYVIVTYLSKLNSKLYLESSIENQVEILGELLKRQDFELKKKIIKNIILFSNSTKSKREIVIFSNLHLLSLIHYALCNNNDLEIDDTTPLQELNLFKALMVIVDIKSKEVTETYNREKNAIDNEFFPKHTWPVLFNQNESLIHNYANTDLVKAMCFFNYLEYHSEFSTYVKMFLSINGQKNSWEYSLNIMNSVLQRWNDEDGNKGNSYLISCDDNIAPFFDSLCINPFEYYSYYINKSEDRIKMKSTPLFKYNSKYVVLDWKFFSNKLYEGLIFDFFNRSGINQLNYVNTIPKFKKVIGLEITEKFIFTRLLKEILGKKHIVLQFSDDDSKGTPDAYYRIGNRIILFEIKDAYFASNALVSNSYEKIKSEIDKKYNNNKKGTGQLIKQIMKLRDFSFEHKSYEELKLKPRNFKIYPKIIYTDIHFGMHGISNYIRNEFDKKAASSNLKKSFKRIEKLTFISLSFLIQYFFTIKEDGFVNIIEKLNKESERRNKKNNFNPNIEHLFICNSSHDTILQDLVKLDDMDKTKLKELVDILNLTEGLPA